MYRTLFSLAGLAIFGWILLIFLPTWKVTRRIADSALFPAYIALLYVAGVVAVFRELGPGIMGDFGSADGVLRLLQLESVALVAWIHILAFDQVVAHLIYRDNMKNRFVPLPIQSVILVITLMLGPLGFLVYWLIRVVRVRGLVAWGERADLPLDPDERPVRFSEVVTERSVIKAALGLLRRERTLTLVALGGFLLAGIAALFALVHGDWLIEPEGRLSEAVRFDLALGIYNLTLAMLLPLAGMSASGQRRWRRWAVGLTLYAYALENIQAWRGLDPRFSNVAGPIDQILGGVFFLQAIGILILFVILTSRFFRDDVLPDHAPLRSALRYAALAANLAFFVGILMSGLGGRVINDTGDLMMIHAAGFHGLQAVPLVALLLGWSRLPLNTALRWVRLAGVGWLLFCFGLLLQALTGAQLTTRDSAFGLGVAGLGAWVIALIYAWWARRSAPAVATA
ncbi:MAG: ABA4-like family protein [Gemmatimonadota bacterium]